MSQEDIEVIRRALDGFAHSDRESVEPLLQPDVKWRTVAGPLLGVETVSGREAMLRFAFEELPEVFDSLHVEVEELTELGEGRVLLVARYLGRGKRSGIDLDRRISSVHRLRDGKIASVRDYPSREEALEDVGLPQ